MSSDAGTIQLRRAEDPLPRGAEALAGLARGEGFRFVDRLIGEWRSGANRFDRTGEALYWAHQSGRLIGCGGLNIDPYASAPEVGRLRHLYVAPELRRSGLGRRLVEALIEDAAPTFSLLRLRTDEAAAFYEAIGFEAVRDEHASHVLRRSMLRPR